MGAMQDAKQEAKDTRRAKAKAQRGRRRSAGESADYQSVDWRPIVALVACLSRHGGAVRLGYTRDGGAYALGVYMGDDYATEYIKPDEDWAEALAEIATLWSPDGGDEFADMLARMAQE